MKLILILRAVLMLALGAAACLAQDAPSSGPKKLIIAKVKAGESSHAGDSFADEKNKMDRVAENLSAQLPAAFKASRRFQIVNRGKAPTPTAETPAMSRPSEFGNADYVLNVTVDDVEDVGGKMAVAIVATTYDARISAVIETFDIAVSRAASEEAKGSAVGGARDDILRELSKELAEKTVQRVADAVYPARIVGKIGQTVTVSRGEGSGIAVGQLWEVFALGEEMKDPDTGAILPREEVSAGKVRITEVKPSETQAAIVNDTGIERGAVVRRVNR